MISFAKSPSLHAKNLVLQDCQIESPLIPTVVILFSHIQTQRDLATILEPFFQPECLVERCMVFASKLEHIMDFTRLRALSSLFSMVKDGVRSVLNYNSTHSDFPMSQVTVNSRCNS